MKVANDKCRMNRKSYQGGGGEGRSNLLKARD